MLTALAKPVSRTKLIPKMDVPLVGGSCGGLQSKLHGIFFEFDR